MFAALAILSAGLGILGEVLMRSFQVGPLENLNGSPSVAICAILLSMAILRSPDPRESSGRSAEIWAATSLFVALVLMAIILTRDTIPWPTDERDKPGSDTLLILIMLSAAVLLRVRNNRLGMWPLAGGLGLMLHGIVGFTFGLPYFGHELAQMTLLTLLVLTAGALTLYSHRPLIRVMFLASEIGARTRVMLAVGTAVPWGCGMLLYHVYGVPGRAVPVELLMFTTIIWSVALVAVISGHINEKSDKRRRDMERLLARQAHSDQLTGLLNRAGMQHKLEAAWQHVEQGQGSAAIVLIDLDHFKRVNDEFGHETGDDVLIGVGRLLEPSLRSTDASARWGGEEILLLMRDTEFEGLVAVTERLRRGIEALGIPLRRKLGADHLHVSASLGVSDIAPEDGGFVEAIRRADAALYAAKENGRNRVVFDPRLRDWAEKSVRTSENASRVSDLAPGSLT